MSSPALTTRKILLIVGGGIAAYKALELVRLLKKAGCEVQAVLTASGSEFVTPLSLAALTGNPVRMGLFLPDEETTMGHIELSRWADLVVVAPATAGLIAKAANGMADDLASTTLLATDKRVLLAPAMNLRMWQHPAVQFNVARLKEFDGFHGMSLVGPDDGEMACGEFGPGRMAEPAAILAAITDLLAGPDRRALAGRRAVVTAGPTFEPIDPVRGLTNRSSGKQGYAIAAALVATPACGAMPDHHIKATAHGCCAVALNSAEQIMGRRFIECLESAIARCKADSQHQFRRHVFGFRRLQARE